MLETTLSTAFVPGTNLKGQAAGANWSFLLPNLELERIVCIGAPPLTTLTTLSNLSQDVIIVCTSSRQMQEIGEVSQKPDLTNIRPMAINGNSALPLPNSSADLALIVGWHSTRQLSRDRALLAELQRLLKPDGLVYFEFGRPADQFLDGEAMNNLIQGFGAPHILWLTPMTGEMHTAVPSRDREIIDYFFRHRLYSPSVQLRVFDRAFDRAERFLSQHRVFSRFVRRYGALVGRAAAELAHQPPQYLRSIAQKAGVNIDHHRWGLSARGRYNTRKVLFFLFGPSTALRRGSGQSSGHRRASQLPDTPPEYIVKIVRDPVLNPRLENEYRALSLLHEKRLGDRETLPQAVFFGYHGNLAIVGETVIDGVPFRQQTEATADCPYARAAIDWLIELSAATANPTAATPGQVAEGLRRLFKRFLEIYWVTPEQHAFLTEQITTVARSQAAFPLVFQHGDPGTWNVMVTKSGRAAFLDWEAAEPQGMPLWDLFYFMRSYIVSAARFRGSRDSLETLGQQFLEASVFSQLFVETTIRYCERMGLSPQLVQPLFYTCWMHRALKEATRLPSARLEKGHYVSLLRLCIDQQSAPTLRHLFQT